MPIRVTRFDYFVFMVVIIVFTWAFFVDSWKPLEDENGNIITDGYGNSYPRINIQVFIAPLIAVYEIFLVCFLDGKAKLREIDWRLHITLFIGGVRNKIKNGKQEYIEWKKIRKTFKQKK